MINPDRGWTHLDALEAEAVFILREIAAQCGSVALLSSGGKDSAVVLRLAECGCVIPTSRAIRTSR
jgi:sulfate adenylyltransferase subunit 2